MPCTRQAKPGLPWEMWPLAATCRGPGHPITLCGLRCARRHARRHQVHRYYHRGRQDGRILRGGARNGRRTAIACCTAADGCCCTRVRRPFARCCSILGIIFGAIESACSRCTQGCAARGPWGAWRGARARHACDRLAVSGACVFRCSCTHISGPREAPGMILGGSDASDRCAVEWCRCERLLSHHIPAISRAIVT